MQENPLKHGILLLVSNQEELNQLAEATQSLALDSLHIDEEYVAFMEEVLIVMPLSQIDESHQYHGIKPRAIKKWFRSVKAKT